MRPLAFDWPRRRAGGRTGRRSEQAGERDASAAAQGRLEGLGKSSGESDTDLSPSKPSVWPGARRAAPLWRGRLSTLHSCRLLGRRLIISALARPFAPPQACSLSRRRRGRKLGQAFKRPQRANLPARNQFAAHLGHLMRPKRRPLKWARPLIKPAVPLTFCALAPAGPNLLLLLVSKLAR